MTSVVGFDRKIKLEWLDALADRVAQGHDATTLRSYLHEALESEHPGETARGKTITVLMRIWALVPEEHHQVREQAFKLLKSVNSKDRIWLHWGMCVMAYPLFTDLVTSVGRLLKLQDEFTWGQLHRRLVSTWGERTTVKKAVPRLVRSLVDWNVLIDVDEENKRFVAAQQRLAKSKEVQVWLIKASHIAQSKDLVEATELLTLPSLFPFKITIGKPDLRKSKDFEVHRQGLDMDMVEMPNFKPKNRSNSKPKSKTCDPRQKILFNDD